jgi:hypothetical protein
VRVGALALAPTLLLLVAGCGSAGHEDTAATAGVRAALEARLDDKMLSYRWVYCLKTKREFEGRRVFRCNVNFGEPHIVRYCATLEGSEFVTNKEQPEMRCGRESSS